MVERKGIVIYFQNKKVIKNIKKFDINISYINEAGRYMTGYVDSKDFNTIKKELNNLKLVKKVDESLIEMPIID